MKKSTRVIITFIFLCVSTPAFALDTPTLTVSTSGFDLSLSWTSISGATGYTLHYAPNPYEGEQTIESVDMETAMNFSTTLWDGASYYVAITASDGSSNSDYSNIELFTLTDDQVVCAAIYNPVCGVDGNTYSNSCNTDVAGIEIDYQGVCGE
ncbi:MAG: Kazal-type serine protease inhibitor family protein [Methyloprofundus sp.]|uniref:Kazal-type serine protease inhibitor family protein n=1 Tax=Methyloprofundus sp. TaxID=2020875 RepID=UPI001A111650|nr:Kazal-type serine protease inhibitor family protein [Methyloprofundus sp.]HIL77753.1 hypothetical protein [Methylococcales bacterium]